MFALSGKNKSLGIATLVLSMGNPLSNAVRGRARVPHALTAETNPTQVNMKWQYSENFVSPYNCTNNYVVPEHIRKMCEFAALQRHF